MPHIVPEGDLFLGGLPRIAHFFAIQHLTGGLPGTAHLWDYSSLFRRSAWNRTIFGSLHLFRLLALIEQYRAVWLIRYLPID